MGLLQPNPAIGTLHGTVGDLVFVRTQDGRLLVRHRPPPRREFKPGELANQSRFTLASAYVKRVRGQPERYAAYEEAARFLRKRACDLANADFWHPPAIQDVDLSSYRGQAGEVIRVEAVDDFAVVAVGIAITALDGTVIERGEAKTSGTGAEWIYTIQATMPAGQTVVVEVTATDRPGNAVIRSFDHALH
jgi:hypothetical protein